MRFSPQAIIVMMVAGGVACGDDSLERVRVCGAFEVPAEVVALRVSALDDQLVELAAGVVELAEGDGLPVTVSLPAISARHVVRAQAIGEDGAEVARSEVLVGAGTDLDPIIVNIARECMGQVCMLGQTCVGGDCTVVPDARADGLCEASTPSPAPSDGDAP